MRYFKAALTQLGKHNVAIIWLEKEMMNDEEEMKQHVLFYKKLLNCPNVALMMLEDNEHPVYFGSKEIVDLLKLNHWKQFPWMSYSLEEHAGK